MAVVNVPNVEAGPLASQPTRPQRRKCTLVSQFCQRIGLLHELRKLAGAKELANGRNDRTDVDQVHGSQRLGLANRHTLHYYSFHTPQADPQFVLNQLAYGLDTAITQVVNVIGIFYAIIDANHTLHQDHQILLGDGAMIEIHIETKPLVQLVAAHPLQVVAPRIKKLLFHILARIVQRGRVARPHTTVELDQRIFGQCASIFELPVRLLTKSRENVRMVGVAVGILKERQQLLISPRAEDIVTRVVIYRRQCPQQNSDGYLALAVELDVDIIGLARLKL